MDERIFHGMREFMVRWDGWGKNEDSWESMDNMEETEALESWRCENEPLPIPAKRRRTRV